MAASTAPVLWSRLKGASPFFLMAGPNVIQSREHCLRMADMIQARRMAQASPCVTCALYGSTVSTPQHELRARTTKSCVPAHSDALTHSRPRTRSCTRTQSVTTRLGIEYVFKASFDKANRTSATSFRGPGMDEGLEILAAVKAQLGVPIVTDIHEAAQAAPVAEVVDVLQIPAFLCRQTDLISAAAQTGRVLQVKKGQWCDASVMEAAAQKAAAAGNERVISCERGTAFGYSDLVVDMRNLVWMRRPSGLVTADVTHALQLPGGRVDASGARSAGGLRELIPAVARAAVAVGVDGLFMEVAP